MAGDRRPDGRGIRVGLLSRLELTAVEQVSVFPPGLRPIQIDDTTVDASAMGRPARTPRSRLAAGPSM